MEERRLLGRDEERELGRKGQGWRANSSASSWLAGKRGVMRGLISPRFCAGGQAELSVTFRPSYSPYFKSHIIYSTNFETLAVGNDSIGRQERTIQPSLTIMFWNSSAVLCTENRNSSWCNFPSRNFLYASTRLVIFSFSVRFLRGTHQCPQSFCESKLGLRITLCLIHLRQSPI